MPPKAKAAQPSKKTVEKKKEKIIEDKTFGLKNKKGAKQQRFIQQVQNQVKSAGNVKRNEQQHSDKKSEKEKKLQEQREMSLLFKPVVTQKVEKGADPKSVLCAYFKQGQCTKGDRCKFSHDLAVERKTEKRSIYCDMRDDEESTMESWGEEKLKEVVEKKEGGKKNMPTTNIICKYFLDAVERSMYGWFWNCPNGPNCIYRHALPPGFVLKKDKKKEDKKDEISLEDLIEHERAALGSNLTRVTKATFLAWKARKLKEKQEESEKEEAKKRLEYKAGRQIGISGREMFYFNPDLAAGDLCDEGDVAFDSYAFQDEGEEEINKVEYHEIELHMLLDQAEEADGTGTQAAEDRLTNLKHSVTNGISSIDERDSPEGAEAVPINENLFLEDDDEDLNELEEQFDELELNQ